MSETKQSENYVRFLEIAIEDYGGSVAKFADSVSAQVQINYIIRKRDSLIRTSMRFLHIRGYVAVFQFTPIDTKDNARMFVPQSQNEKDPFDRDWNTFKYLEDMAALLPERSLARSRLYSSTHVLTSKLKRIFEADNTQISTVFTLMKSAGYETNILVKKDERAAEILLEKMNEKKIEK